MNIQENYVSFEIAKLLREKGFDWYTYDYYEDEDNPNISLRASKAINWNKTEFISKPTLQMAMKWLREIHNIHIVIKIVIRTYGDTEYYYELYGTKNKSLCVVCDIYKGESWDSSEKACGAAIKYCLENLI